MSDQERRNFTRTVEDFTCVRCATLVHGNGYTNHCPACLWSLHVDVVPGDRAEPCRGAMRPVEVETRRDGYVIRHECVACGASRATRANPADSVDAMVAVAQERADLLTRGGSSRRR
jgi:hypothetical protein